MLSNHLMTSRFSRVFSHNRASLANVTSVTDRRTEEHLSIDAYIYKEWNVANL